MGGMQSRSSNIRIASGLLYNVPVCELSNIIRIVALLETDIVFIVTKYLQLNKSF